MNDEFDIPDFPPAAPEPAPEPIIPEPDTETRTEVPGGTPVSDTVEPPPPPPSDGEPD